MRLYVEGKGIIEKSVYSERIIWPYTFKLRPMTCMFCRGRDQCCSLMSQNDGYKHDINDYGNYKTKLLLCMFFKPTDMNEL